MTHFILLNFATESKLKYISGLESQQKFRKVYLNSERKMCFITIIMMMKLEVNSTKQLHLLLYRL